MPTNFQQYLDLILAMGMQYAGKVLLALVTLWVGFWAVRLLMRALQRTLHHKRVDPSLAGFLESTASVVLKILVLMTVAMTVGIQMASFIAVLGAAGLALGLSLQGSLANLAGGILILFFKPFVVGEDISALTHRGVVEKIEMFSTIVRGSDGTMIILPNGPLSNGVIVNHTRSR